MLQDGHNQKSTRVHALHTNKEENLKDWKERWLDAVGIGRFAWVNRHPPAWKPSPTPTQLAKT
jgi:hypothetical protein